MPPIRKVGYDWLFVLALIGALTIFPLRLPQIDRFSPSVKPQPMRTFRKPLAPRVLFMMIDAMGANVAYEPGWMPRLQERAAQGASGTALASFPTITVSGVVSLMCGHRLQPGLQMVENMDVGREADSVFARAADAGLKSIVVAQQDWERAFKGHGAKLDIVPFRGAPPYIYDDQILKLALRAVKGEEGGWNFLAVHFFDLDPIGHVTGVGSPLYREKLLWLDQRIQELAALAGPQACVIVTADHGMTWSGTHGGTEPGARRIPLVLWGNRIRRAALGEEIEQNDIASTISALLGLPPPSLSGGLPLMAALKASPKEAAAIWLDILEQRNRRWFAARSDWPWLSENPDARLRKAQGLFAAGRYEDSHRLAQEAVRDMDQALGESAPKKWFGQLVLAFWLLALAACFALTWPAAFVWARNLAIALGACALLALFVPLLAPDFWAPCAKLGLACCAALLLLSLLPGWRAPAMSWPRWALWWLILAAIALPQVMDISLWAYAMILGIILCKLPGLNKSSAGYLALCLAVLSLYAALGLWIPGSEMSLARSWLPKIAAQKWGAPPWHVVKAAAFVAAAAICWLRFQVFPDRRRRLLAWLCALGPVAISALCSNFKFHPLAGSWLAAIASLAAARVLRAPVPIQGLWLSSAVFSCCQPLLNPTELCFAALQVLFSWGLGALKRPAAARWRSLEIIGLCLWAYATPGGGLDLSHISVQEVYMVLGRTWSVPVLAGLLVAKHVGALMAPVVALLADVPFKDLLGAFPLFGFWSGGNLFVLWFDLFFLGVAPANLLNEHSFEMSLWAALFAWLLPAAWVCCRIAGYRAARAGSKSG